MKTINYYHANHNNNNSLPRIYQGGSSSGINNNNNYYTSSGVPVSSNAENLDFTSFAGLDDMRTFDQMILRRYWNSLSEHVRKYDYDDDFEKAQEEFDVLIDHWFGMLLLDMAKSSVADRKNLKNQPDLKKMMSWAEKTSARVLLMSAAKRASERTKKKNSN